MRAERGSADRGELVGPTAVVGLDGLDQALRLQAR
jgi:hypothetical protein